MSKRMLLAAVLAAGYAPWAYAQEAGGKPGDLGYRHDDYHRRGLIEELERKVGHSCCDGAGECRASYVDLARRKAFVEGQWCPIGYRTAIRTDIALPDRFALVCAGRPAGPLNPCPPIYCIALSPGT